MAIPGVVIGGTIVLLAMPFNCMDIGSFYSGVMLGVAGGYIAGQRLAWPVYGVEKPVELWVR